MKRVVVSGTPGVGKTTVVRALAAHGYGVVEEAATDIIAQLHADGHERPWERDGFIDAIAAEQRRRLDQPVPEGAVALLLDRSPVCTVALARWSDRPVSASLRAAVDRLLADETVDRRVLFLRPLGFIVPTQARRISYELALEFEKLHEQAYAECGFTLVDIGPTTVDERVATIDRYLRAWISAG